MKTVVLTNKVWNNKEFNFDIEIVSNCGETWVVITSDEDAETLKDWNDCYVQDTYIVRCRENGDLIELFSTLEDATNEVKKYEESDKKEGVYTENFYEIYDVQNEIAY